MTLLLPDPILDLDATDLADATRRGDLTCGEVTRTYLDRLEALNPRLRAVITVHPDARAGPTRWTLWTGRARPAARPARC